MNPRANVVDYGNDLTSVQSYVIPKGTTVYHGSVAGGAGYQYYMPSPTAAGGVDTAMFEHIQRTHAALADMGSIGDIVISGDAGHHVSSIDVEKLNARLSELVELLFATTTELLARYRR